MTRNRQQVTRILGWSGLIPFAALALAAWIGTPDWVDRVLIGYAVAILSFVCGSLWMAALQAESERPEALVASNAIVLAALPALVLPLAWGAPWLAVLFAAQFVAELRWVGRAHAGWYRRLRTMLTSVGVVLLVLAGLASLSTQGAA
jgi:hypothetical protein